MKNIRIELDDRCARDLERVAPAKKRMRAEFLRLAIRRAIDLALDRVTERAYMADPMPRGLVPADGIGWDPDNRLAKAPRATTPRSRRKRTTRAA